MDFKKFKRITSKIKDETVLTSLRLEKDLYEKFHAITLKHGYVKTKIFNSLVKEFIRLHEEKEENGH